MKRLIEKGARRIWIPALLIAGLGTTVSMIAFVNVRQAESSTAQEQFLFAAQEREHAIESAIAERLFVLRAVRSVFDASNEVDRDEFTSCVVPHFERVAGIRSLLWVPRLAETNRDDFERTARQDGLEGYQVRSWLESGEFIRSASRPEYHPVYYGEPYHDNQHLLGLDCGEIADIKIGLDEARDFDDIRALRAAELPGGEADDIALAIPIYDRDGITFTVPGRRQAIEGFIVGIFSWDGLIAAAYDDLEEIGVHTFFTTDPDPTWHQVAADSADDEAGIDASLPQRSRSLRVADTARTLLFQATPTFLSNQRTSTPWWVLTGGLVITTLLSAWVAAFGGRAAKVAALVEVRTSELAEKNVKLSEEILVRYEAQQALQESEQRMRSILDSVNAGIVVIDPETMRIVELNPASCLLLDAPREEILARRSVDVLGESCEESLRRAHRGDSLKNEEAALYGHDGRNIPVLETVCEVIYDGRPHLLLSFVDISERKAAERELNRTHEQLVQASRMAGMAEIATGVLHNVGNGLNSVNVSAEVVADRIRGQKISELGKVIDLLGEHQDDIGTFLSEDDKGKHVLPYLARLTDLMAEGRDGILDELRELAGRIDHIKNTISMQQAYASKSGGAAETVEVDQLIEELLRMEAVALENHGVTVCREYEPLPGITLEKHKFLQILMNLVRNARHAMAETDEGERTLTIRLGPSTEGHFRLEVTDNGVGISQENLDQIFAYGFTTKKNGHGFGLHNSALVAAEMGGSLKVTSEGLGKGASFVIDLPLEAAEQPAPDFSVA